MNAVSIELNTRQLQLLAINTLFEQARLGVQDGESCIEALQNIIDLGSRAAADPHAVRSHELDDAEAEVLFHALRS
ncbi:hypothetical protein Q9Q94_13630 [Uliginosibacterium sp. 31-16]|uniref:hypothetical protein n=1 Tax=Uliginosibacterium sp. 31-16 TaxID=3068315 RepID=UPI00273E0246|nr:hypothetical protein [Uliginosibacterium sp. 31-16]MDP5240580.1 hypothetical protein [Uliginosibacterium sp. 31-16]